MIKYTYFIVILAGFVCAEQALLAPCDSLYEKREFGSALKCIHLKINSASLKQKRDSLRAFERAAILYYILEDFQESNRFFDQLLLINPNYELDPVSVPPEILALYKNRKEAREMANKPEKSLLRLLPYGAGHIKEKKIKRGIVYIGVSVIALGMNIAMYNWRKSIERTDGTYDNPQQAANLQSVQLWAFYGGFVGTGLVSFVDALLTN
jgi:tetratricopeptide (TPR) repeat protein